MRATASWRPAITRASMFPPCMRMRRAAYNGEQRAPASGGAMEQLHVAAAACRAAESRERRHAIPPPRERLHVEVASTSKE
ncbi:hypothetical protein Dimus_022725 [Dionaea muscipula]